MQQQQSYEETTSRALYIVPSTAKRYRHFGALLAEWRTNAGVSRPYVIECLPQYCTRQGLARLQLEQPRSQADIVPMSVGQYGKLERQEKRAPKFDELLPLYVTLTVGCGAEPAEGDRQAYLELARAAIEAKIHHRENIAPEFWEALADQLARSDGLDLAALKKGGQEQSRHQVSAKDLTQVRSGDALLPNRHLSSEVLRVLRKDTSHILERDIWVEQMLGYQEEGKRLVTIQAISGAGKTRALYMLLKRLAALPNCWPFFYAFRVGAGKTPDDYLDTFLAALRVDLQLFSPEEKISREASIEQVLIEMQRQSMEGKRVALLLDDVQIVLDSSTGELSDAWQSFLDAFVSEEHRSTLYLATREWPHWHMRDRSFLQETELPKLSLDAATLIWQRLGFNDVSKDLLYRASKKCDGNPQLIELGASSLDRPGRVYLWPRRGGALSHQETDERHAERLSTWLDEDTVFDKTDVAARQELAQALSERIPQQAYQLLDLLAISPLGVPLPLLEQEMDHPETAIDALARCSLVDHEAAKEGRVGLLSLAREARLLQISQEQREQTGQHATDLYSTWLTKLQDFRDDTEKSALVAEMVVRYIRSRQLLKAAELFVSFGWLCVLFGQTSRICRAFEEVVREDRGKEEDVQHEVGRLILQHRIAVHSSRQEVERSWRDQIYQNIHKKIVTGEVALQPHSELEVLHNMLLFYSRSGQLVEADSLFEQTFEHLQHSGQMTPEVYALFLGNKTRLFSHWWDKTENKHNQEDIQDLQQKCIAAFKESIAQWRLCLKNALPLQEHYYRFKMARVLNDYAYRLRLTGNLDEAQEAIEESLHLKKAGNALPHSVAISLSEYAQILALKGQIRKALPAKEEAIAGLEHLSNEGDISHNSELGVFLFEHASILKQQARLEEAKAELERAIPLIGNKPTRQHFRVKAEQDLEEISLILETEQHYQLDKRWFQRYLELASYKEVDWIASTGPFSDEEQAEWESLYPRREREEISDRLKALLVQSQQREFALSQEEKRAPRLWYPYIPLEEVLDRIKRFVQLQHDIEQEEENAVVRALYTDVINEQIIRLRQYEATVLGNQHAVWQCNLTLYGKPSTHEFCIALQALCKMVLEAQNHEQAGPVAQDVLHQLKAWGLLPQEIMAMQFFSSKQEPVPSFKQKLINGEREFSPVAVQRFFQDVLTHEYHAEDWKVEIEPTRTGAGVDVNVKTLFLPPKSFSLEKIRELLAEEIEVHAYRSLSGIKSPLALLGSGLARYSATEEGLAKHSIQQVSQQMQSEERSKTWIWTLATGLASGVLTPALSFYELATFLEKKFLIEKLLSSKSITWEKAVAAARQLAWSRAVRAFRGVPHLEEAGCCSLKDVIYLRGYLAVKQALEQVDEERFLVGKVGVEHLDAMSELNILAPFCSHRHLALASDLFDRVSHYEK